MQVKRSVQVIYGRLKGGESAHEASAGLIWCENAVTL